MLLYKKLCFLIPYFFTLTFYLNGAENLVINEIQVANMDQYIDPSWNYGSWVELYNPAEEDISLQGYWISIDPQKNKMARITQKLIVPAGGFANLWFDHHDKYYPTQINLKLDAEGGSVLLSNAEGQIVSQIDYPPCMPRASWACTEDGGQEWQWSSTPSPAASNQGMTFCMNRISAPQVNKPSQLFQGSLTVKVEIPEACTLRYTTDGSTPSMKNGKSVTDTCQAFFTVSESTIYRFALFREGWLMSPVVTRSFLLQDKKISLPIISVVTDPDNLYSQELGIFVRGVNGRPGRHQSTACNWNMDWDRPCNFEYLNAEGHSLINQEAEMKRCGAASRAWVPYSFKIHAKKIYEFENTLNYAFFSAKPYIKHKTLQIRNGGNDTKCRAMDPFLQQIVGSSGLGVDYQEYQPVAHYINGTYKGVINMREPNNKHHVYANYGLDAEEIDLFEMDADSGYIQQCGTNVAWKQLLKLSRFSPSETYYEQIKQKLDIDEFCEYMSVVFYVCCTDWPNNNLKAFRPIQDNGRFRFILYDLDWSFRTEKPFDQFVNKNTFTFNRLYGEPIQSITQEIEVVTLFLNLLRNDSFRKKFIDTFCLVAGSVFEPNRCKDIITQLANNVNEMQQLDDNGYGMNYSPWETANKMIASLDAEHQKNLLRELKNFAPMRLDNVTGQPVTLNSNIPTATILVNGLVVPTNYFSGELYSPITLKVIATANYRFVGWIQKEGHSIKYISREQEIKLPSSDSHLNLVAFFEKNEVDGVQSPVVINEVSASNSIYVNEYYKKKDWVELYNLTDKDIDLAGMYLSDDIEKPTKYTISSENTQTGTIIPAHGFVVIWCDELKTRSQLHAPFKLANEDYACVLLTAKDQSWADTLVYCAHQGRESVGRFPDGGKNVYRMSNPSIGKFNRWTSYNDIWDATTTALEKRTSLFANTGAISIICKDRSLHIKSEEQPDVKLQIFTIDGVLVMSQNLSTDGGKAKVNLSMLPMGTYVAYLNAPEEERCSIKFVLK